MDINSILDIVLNQGIWCVLFVYFYVTQQNRNAEREERYLTQIDKFSEALEKINDNLTEVKQEVANMKDK